MEKNKERERNKELLGLTHGFVERGDRGRAMHVGKVLYAQSSLVKV